MLHYDAKAVARLEKSYSSPQILDQRRCLRSILGARKGEAGLDVGCGVAYLACELAKEVAPGGHIAAIDSSPESVEASTARVAKEGLAGLVDVRVGDAANLEYPDETFDFVVSAQVYCYVPNVARALSEAARVLRKGGRLVVLDSDWDMCIWESRDYSLTRRIIAARSTFQFAHAHLPRKLHRLIRAAGLTLASAQSFPIIETHYDPNSFSVGIIESMCDGASKQGISPEEIDRWAADLQSRKSDGEWFFCLSRFIFVATK